MPLSVAIAQGQHSVSGEATSAETSLAERLDLQPAQERGSGNCLDAVAVDEGDSNLSQTKLGRMVGIRDWLESAKVGIASRFKRFAGGSQAATNTPEGAANQERDRE
jgi:hypothetical protein